MLLAIRSGHPRNPGTTRSPDRWKGSSARTPSPHPQPPSPGPPSLAPGWPQQHAHHGSVPPTALCADRGCPADLVPLGVPQLLQLGKVIDLNEVPVRNGAPAISSPPPLRESPARQLPYTTHRHELLFGPSRYLIIGRSVRRSKHCGRSARRPLSSAGTIRGIRSRAIRHLIDGSLGNGQLSSGLFHSGCHNTSQLVLLVGGGSLCLRANAACTLLSCGGDRRVLLTVHAIVAHRHIADNAFGEGPLAWSCWTVR